MSVSSQRPVHLLVRFSDNLFAVGDAIAKHQEVIRQSGSVWFGKLGTPIGQKAADGFISQIEKGIPTYLYLVKGNRKDEPSTKQSYSLYPTIFPKKKKRLSALLLREENCKADEVMGENYRYSTAGA